MLAYESGKKQNDYCCQSTYCQIVRCMVLSKYCYTYHLVFRNAVYVFASPPTKNSDIMVPGADAKTMTEPSTRLYVMHHGLFNTRLGHCFKATFFPSFRVSVGHVEKRACFRGESSPRKHAHEVCGCTILSGFIVTPLASASQARPDQRQHQRFLVFGSCFINQSVIASRIAAACVTSRRAQAISNAILRSLGILPRTSLICSLIGSMPLSKPIFTQLPRQKLTCALSLCELLRHCAYKFSLSPVQSSWVQAICRFS